MKTRLITAVAALLSCGEKRPDSFDLFLTPLISSVYTDRAGTALRLVRTA